MHFCSRLIAANKKCLILNRLSSVAFDFRLSGWHNNINWDSAKNCLLNEKRSRLSTDDRSVVYMCVCACARAPCERRFCQQFLERLFWVCFVWLFFFFAQNKRRKSARYTRRTIIVVIVGGHSSQMIKRHQFRFGRFVAIGGRRPQRRDYYYYYSFFCAKFKTIIRKFPSHDFDALAALSSHYFRNCARLASRWSFINSLYVRDSCDGAAGAAWPTHFGTQSYGNAMVLVESYDRGLPQPWQAASTSHLALVSIARKT